MEPAHETEEREGGGHILHPSIAIDRVMALSLDANAIWTAMHGFSPCAIPMLGSPKTSWQPM
jgi:hypothetical protein